MVPVNAGSPAISVPGRVALGVALALASALPAKAQHQLNPGDYMTVRQGGIPIVISAPHGGDRLLPGVSERQDTGQKFFTLMRDQRTAELAERIAAHLAKRLRGEPFLVIARFDRRHIDANRAPLDAYTQPGEGGPKQVYHAFHTAIADATGEIDRRWGGGLLIDLHGQSRFPDLIIRGTRNGRTVAHLLKRHGPDALSGPKSLFGALAAAGYKISPTGKADEQIERYFTGGHIVDTHGSSEGGRIDAIQVEVGSSYRSPEKLERTAADIAAALETFALAYLPLSKSR